MENKMIKGQFSLDKKLRDGRRSPKALYPNEDEDVLIIDQHTDDNDQILYTRTVGVAKQVENADGKLEFDWVVTDPSLKELVSNAKHPEKLFKYSPEFKPINVTDEYDQGEFGQLKQIAITNMANDDNAITTKIYSMMKNIFKGGNEGDDMDKQEVEQIMDEKLQPILDKIGEMKEIESKLQGADFEGLKEVVDGFKAIQTDVETLQKNVKEITQEDEEAKEELVKNIMTNGEFDDEETLKLMKMADLQKLNDKLAKDSPGAGSGSPSKKKTVVDVINEKYGLNIGEKLKSQ